MADMIREAPRWLYLERRSRAEFQRSFYRQYDGSDYDVMKRLGREALNAVTLRRIYPEGMRRIREHQRAGHRVLLLTGALDVVVEPLAELLGVEVDSAHVLVRDGRMTGDLQSPPPAGEARGPALRGHGCCPPAPAAGGRGGGHAPRGVPHSQRYRAVGVVCFRRLAVRPADAGG